MSRGPAGIRAIEEAADRAWPPRRAVHGDDWVARYADGWYRRLNSATVWGSADFDDTFATIEAWYAARRQPARFKLTPASPAGLETALERRGYQREESSVTVMTRPLRADLPPGEAEIAPAATGAWVDAFAAISGYDRHERAMLTATLKRITPRTGYAAVLAGGHPVALGLAVAEGEHAGVFDVATHPAHRRQGLATRIVAALLRWSAGCGATTAYLQVFEGNLAAHLLYLQAGFSPRYDYWYRLAADRVPGHHH